MFQNKELLLVQQTASFFYLLSKKDLFLLTEPIHLLAPTLWQQHAVILGWRMVKKNFMRKGNNEAWGNK